MKGHARKHRETGGVNEAEEDLERKTPSRTNNKEIAEEAEEKSEKGEEKFKRGGRTKKNVGGIAGGASRPSAARRPRKSGGRAQAVAETNPFSTARHGKAPKGREVQLEME